MSERTDNYSKPNPKDRLSTPVLSVAERIDTSLIEDSSILELINAERNIPVVVGIDKSLRPKILDKCGMTCVFCHNEGTPVADAKKGLAKLSIANSRVSIFEATNGVDFIPGVMSPDEKFKEALSSMMAATNSTELHLTGGEPTLHKNLPDLIKIATDLGYDVKMTSNGENGRYHIRECADAGLKKINFSIFGTTPEELAEVQHSRYSNEKLAKVKLDALHASIQETLSNGVEVDANIVMSDYSHSERVARIIHRYGDKATIRILNDLDAGQESYLAIYKLLAELGAKPTELYVEAGTSNSRVKYVLPEGRAIYFKQIRRTTLSEICDSCDLNNEQDCAEGYYGLRLYIDSKQEYKVGVCLQRMDLTENLEDFITSSLPGQIVEFREREYNLLTDFYSDRLSSGGNI